MSQQASNPFAHFTGLYRPPTPQQQQPQPQSTGTGIDLLNFMRPMQQQPMVIPSDLYSGPPATRLPQPITPKSAAASAKTLQLINDLKQYSDQTSKSSG